MTTKPNHRILVTVEGGVIQHIDHIPAGVTVEVWDFDKDGDRERPSWSEERGVLVGVWDARGEVERDNAEKPERSPLALPPDPDDMNDDRSEWAGKAIEAFQKATGCDDEDALGDLLADLMHWADRRRLDFRVALDQAKAHYQEETMGEQETRVA